jgi:hypothetical protein
MQAEMPKATSLAKSWCGNGVSDMHVNNSTTLDAAKNI